MVALLVYVGIRWVLPALGGSNIFLRGLGEVLRDKAWMFATAFIVVAGVAEIFSRYRRKLFDGQIGLEGIQALPWRDFERLVGEAFRRQGYVVEEVGGSAPDGGVDLVLHREGSIPNREIDPVNFIGELINCGRG